MARTGYQLLGPSPWPVTAAVAVLGLCSTLLIFVCEGASWGFWVSFVVCFGLLITIMANWWSDVVKESTYLGQWSSYVLRAYVWGFRLFIISEVFFFAGLLGAFVYCAVGESSIHGVGFWPPRGIKPLSPGKMALLNTAVLLGSSVTANWALCCVKAHNCLNFNMSVPLSVLTPFKKSVNGMKKNVDTFYYQESGLVALMVTICLGLCFTYLQALEYYWASFSFGDGIYGSSFFLLTGFHGLHVIIGTIFLVVCWFRLLNFHFSFNHFYFGMWAAVWYWHFVDIVWVFVYGMVYIWGYWGYS
uniref:Cytochrome c oxidase subunit 3 n=1 Tax=Meretrix lusoria TaxID=74491 RepID=E5D142_MERLU|nr:cytochrome c oxidase subunit III [Meretrix lusoria]ACV92125.1 cytochrome c oxidase subunit III [Meretrix lusoria]